MSSIHDVARRAGVSTATVSRALRGVDRVSVSTRDRVLRAATELHYVASPTAASLATGRTGVVGVLAPYVSRWFFATVLDGVERTLHEHGLNVMLFSAGQRDESNTLLRHLELLRKRLDALLIVSVDLDALEITMLQRLRVPIVTIGLDAGEWDTVGIDDVAAGELAMSYLLGLGHRSTAFLGGDRRRDVHRATAHHRAQGVRRALTRAGLPADDAEHLIGDWTVEGAARTTHALLSRACPPTALLAASDEMAMGMLLAAHRLGVRVPEQLSVMGIDDHELAVSHDLTTVAQPVREQGETAARMLVESVLIPRRTQLPPAERQVHLLPTRLVVRGSTARPQLVRPRAATA